MNRILSCFQSKSLVSHILQGNNLLPYFFLRQLFPSNMLVLIMIGTVYTAVNTVVGKIQRSKHNNAIAIQLLLDLFCQRKHLFIFLRKITFQ